ncbi:uncharacterized protein LOC103524116 [Trichonephila clavipes]|nr:uncharacterized protein LOC103524116 [Trichonephila clavipes]
MNFESVPHFYADSWFGKPLLRYEYLYQRFLELFFFRPWNPISHVSINLHTKSGAIVVVRSRHRFPIFKPTTFPGHLRYASAKLDFVQPVRKHNSLLAELRSSALATIHERYPGQDWLHVFTDDSATASFGRTGVGAFSNSFNLKEPISAWSDSFDGEIFAIFMAFRDISAIPGPNIVIFIDSQAAIKTASGYNLFPSKLEFECKKLINSFLSTGREVALQWIPSHCGIDELAKEASTLHPPCLSMPLRNDKRFLRDKFRQKRISTDRAGC